MLCIEIHKLTVVQNILNIFEFPNYVSENDILGACLDPVLYEILDKK